MDIKLPTKVDIPLNKQTEEEGEAKEEAAAAAEEEEEEEEVFRYLSVDSCLTEKVSVLYKAMKTEILLEKNKQNKNKKIKTNEIMTRFVN